MNNDIRDNVAFALFSTTVTGTNLLWLVGSTNLAYMGRLNGNESCSEKIIVQQRRMCYLDRWFTPFWRNKIQSNKKHEPYHSMAKVDDNLITVGKQTETGIYRNQHQNKCWL